MVTKKMTARQKVEANDNEEFRQPINNSLKTITLTIKKLVKFKI